MKNRSILINLILISLIGLWRNNIIQGQEPESQQIQGQIRQEDQLLRQRLFLKQGLFLRRGMGVSERLRIGGTVHPADYMIIEEFQRLFGLDLDTSSTGIIRSIKCDKPGCYTDNNVAIGELKGTVIRRFGLPLQEKPLRETGEVFIAYEGVAFVIGAKGRVKEIYIIPRPRKK